MGPIITMAGKVLLSMLLSFATEKAFTSLVLWAVGKGVKSTKTTWDDELYNQLKKNLEERQSSPD